MGARSLTLARAAARLFQLAVTATLLAAGVTYAWLQMFSQFQIYDDEGYMMASVKTFLGGQALYDRTFTQYGPFYYLGAGLFYRIARLPVGHDVTRVITIVLWIATASLLAAFVYRVTRSLALAALAYLQAVLHCTGLIGEPGHPQGLLLVLVCGLLMAGSAVPFATAGPVALGIVAGAIVMTKINVGVFTAGACTVALLARSRRHRLAAIVAAAVFSVLPFVVMRANLSGPTLIYAIVAASAIAGCSVAAIRFAPEANGSLRPFAMFVAGAAGAALVMAVCVVALGTSPRALFDGVVVSPLRFGNVYGQTWALPPAAAKNGAAAVVLAVFVSFIRPAGALRIAGVVLKVAFAFFMTRAAFEGPIAMATLAPFVWVLLVPGGEAAAQQWFPRALIALVAASQLLVAYPVAGNQQAWATLWLLSASLVGAADAAVTICRKPDAWMPRIADLAMLAAVLYWFYPAYQTASLRERYRIFAPLDLPHSEMIRLPRIQKRTLEELVRNVRANCSTFVTMPGMNSFYFWTKTEPPTGLNATAWMTLFDDATQQRLVDRIASESAACVIYHEGLFNGWIAGHHVDERPLVRYIRSSFHTVHTVGEYQVMVRNGREIAR